MTVEVNFYHLTSSSKQLAMPRLLARIVTAHKVLVRVETAERLKELNDFFWSFSTKLFLPHGIKGEGFEDKQPVFLTASNENMNNAKILFEDNPKIPADFNQFEKIIDMFDGTNEDELQAARKRWVEYKKLGVKSNYYQQDNKGNWSIAASS